MTEKATDLGGGFMKKIGYQDSMESGIHVLVLILSGI